MRDVADDGRINLDDVNNICINKMTNKKLQPTMGRGSVTTEQAGEQMLMPVR